MSIEGWPQDIAYDEKLRAAALEDSERSSLRQYVLDISTQPLLKDEEAVTLAHMIRDGQAARELIAEDNPTDEERQELEQISELGDDAWTQLVNSNLRLVVNLAKKFHSPTVPLLDRIQDGNIGLFRAAEEFNPVMGTKFSTYAQDWIWGHIHRGLIEKKRIIRFPEHAHYDQLAILKAEAEIIEKTGIKPSSEELAEETGMSLEYVVTLRLAHDPVSLEALIEEAPQLEAGIKASDEEPFELEPDRVSSLMAELTPSQQEVFLRLLGGMTLDEVASELGIKMNSLERSIGRARKRAEKRSSTESSQD